MSYVYQYLDLDGKPFYIGKGSGGRKDLHLAEAKRKIEKEERGRVSYCVSAIMKMLINNTEPTIEIIKDCMTEDEAFNLEIELIKKHGRKGLDENGILTNRAIGGYGGLEGRTFTGRKGHKMSDYSKQKLIERNKASKGKKKPGLARWIAENPEKHWSSRQKGTTRSDEAKLNMSIAQKEKQCGAKIMVFRSPDGVITETADWKIFLKENGLSYNLIRLATNPLNNGQITKGPNKGWFVVEQKYLHDRG